MSERVPKNNQSESYTVDKLHGIGGVNNDFASRVSELTEDLAIFYSQQLPFQSPEEIAEAMMHGLNLTIETLIDEEKITTFIKQFEIEE